MYLKELAKYCFSFELLERSYPSLSISPHVLDSFSHPLFLFLIIIFCHPALKTQTLYLEQG